MDLSGVGVRFRMASCDFRATCYEYPASEGVGATKGKAIEALRENIKADIEREAEKKLVEPMVEKKMVVIFCSECDKDSEFSEVNVMRGVKFEEVYVCSVCGHTLDKDLTFLMEDMGNPFTQMEDAEEKKEEKAGKMKYKIVTGGSESVLCDLVEKAIDDGWVPSGGVAYGSEMFYQAMVKG